MDLKKCPRCGEFHLSNINVCEMCGKKDMQELMKLNEYLESNGISYNKFDNKEIFENTILETGLSSQNLERYINSYLTGYEL